MREKTSARREEINRGENQEGDREKGEHQENVQSGCWKGEGKVGEECGKTCSFVLYCTFIEQ